MLPQMKVYQIFEDHNWCVELLENYSKCRFDIISIEFEKLRTKIRSDPFLVNNANKINFDFKSNIVREIVRSSSSVSIKYISDIIKEKDSNVEIWILNGISDGSIRAKIDDIDKVIYSHESNTLLSTYNKATEFAKRQYVNSINKLISSLSVKINYEVDKSTLKPLKMEKMQMDFADVNMTDEY
jgi:hypothetical protein